MEIRIGVVGRIVEGDQCGHYVKVVDDSENTGGLLVLTCAKPDMGKCFDAWVESADALHDYFTEASWLIEWPKKVDAHL
jgi:hypothetical protein